MFSGIVQYLLVTLSYFIFSVISWISNQYFIQTEYFKKGKFSRLTFFAVSIICGFCFSFLLQYTITGMDKFFGGASLGDHKLLLLPILFRGTLFNVLNAFLVFHLHEVKEKEQSQLELAALKQAQLQADMSILKEQLSPHFLFNAFSNITTLTREQPVADYVQHLADVYRYLLSHQKKDCVLLQEELTFTESYLYIIKTRLEQAISISIDVPKHFLNCKIPPLTLQLLMENAIKHNITSTARPLKIRLYTVGKKLIITNNIQLRSSVTTSSGIGLGNIADRYRLLFNENISIEKTDDLFLVALPLIYESTDH